MNNVIDTILIFANPLKVDRSTACNLHRLYELERVRLVGLLNFLKRRYLLTNDLDLVRDYFANWINEEILCFLDYEGSRVYLSIDVYELIDDLFMYYPIDTWCDQVMRIINDLPEGDIDIYLSLCTASRRYNADNLFEFFKPITDPESDDTIMYKMDMFMEILYRVVGDYICPAQN